MAQGHAINDTDRDTVSLNAIVHEKRIRVPECLNVYASPNGENAVPWRNRRVTSAHIAVVSFST